MVCNYKYITKGPDRCIVTIKKKDGVEDEHEFEALAQEFIGQEDWHEAATSRNYLEEEIITNKPFYQEMQPNKILNVAQPVIFDDKSLKIPSILEVIDLEKKVFKVSEESSYNDVPL